MRLHYTKRTAYFSIVFFLIAGIAFSVSLSGDAFSQVPRSICYQGLLLKNSQPVNSFVNLHIKIYDAAGDSLYQESFDNVKVTSGIYNVLIGSSAGILPQSL